MSRHLVSQRSVNLWRVLLLNFMPKEELQLYYFRTHRKLNRWKIWRNESGMTLQSRGGSNGGYEKSAYTCNTQTSIWKVALMPLWLKDDLYIIRLRSYSTLNHLNWTRNEKIMSIESKRGTREENRRKTGFITGKSLFLFLLFYHYSFASAVERLIEGSS